MQNEDNMKYSDFIVNLLANVRKAKHKATQDYSTLSDTASRTITIEKTTAHSLPILDNTLFDRLSLLERANAVVREYSSMKNFILDVYVGFAVHGMGSIKNNNVNYDIHKQAVLKIKEEMEENFLTITYLTGFMSDGGRSSLERNIIYSDLMNLVEDLEIRLSSYRPYYQSYVLDGKYAH